MLVIMGSSAERYIVWTDVDAIGLTSWERRLNRECWALLAIMRPYRERGSFADELCREASHG